jgi:outer membrane protein TolC
MLALVKLALRRPYTFMVLALLILTQKIGQFEYTVKLNDNLSLLHYLGEENEALLHATQAAHHSYDLAMNRYREGGVVSYLEVIDAEIAKLRTEQTELNIEVQRMQASVGLVRALGGDW